MRSPVPVCRSGGRCGAAGGVEPHATNDHALHSCVRLHKMHCSIGAQFDERSTLRSKQTSLSLSRQTWQRERDEYQSEIMALRAQKASLEAELQRRAAQLDGEPWDAPLEETGSPVSRPLSISPCSSGSDLAPRTLPIVRRVDSRDTGSRAMGLRQRLVIADKTHRRLQRESTLTKVLTPPALRLLATSCRTNNTRECSCWPTQHA